VNITNPPKALILMLALCCLTILLSLGKLEQDVAAPMMTAIIFYGIGNGVAAKSGKDSPKIFGPKNDGD
jgi:hypothetical protein